MNLVPAAKSSGTDSGATFQGGTLMKKYFALCALLAAQVPLAVSAQEFLFSGEIKTGVYWESRQMGDEEPEQLMQLGNTDDAGGFNPAGKNINIPGRFRLNLEFKPISSMGFKVRFEDMKFTGAAVSWAYSYGYGNFLSDQLKISAGKLGESPWKTEGPEIWGAIDEYAEIRAEYKPDFVPGLNVGLVLNQPNNMLDRTKFDYDFGNFMNETVFGVAYSHDLFDLRFAWRLDGEDQDNLMYEDGNSMVYRLEEKALRTLAPGLSLWVNGLWAGLVNGDNGMKNYQNWFYAAYSNAGIDAQFRTGFQLANQYGDDFHRKSLTFKVRGFYSFTSMFSAGLSFTFTKDFGDINKDLAYEIITIEPQVKVTFNQNAYVAFVYGYQQIPRHDVLEKANYINLRLVYSF